MSSIEVIRHLKSIMASHGIPAETVLDNRPQLSAEVFAKLTKSYGIIHLTSSPQYPQRNGEAEWAVKRAKFILNKSEDPYLDLLAYYITAIHNGHSPSQLLMKRTLKSTISSFKLTCQIKLNLQRGSRKLNNIRGSVIAIINPETLKPLKEGETVWMSYRKEMEQLWGRKLQNLT